jgi:CheY-like chemotaxis protein
VVVVADDEPAMLDVLVQHLKAARAPRFEVTAAEDGEEAWEQIHKLLPDLVVLDVMMPGMSGWEVCRKIRESPALAHTAVVILTGIGERTNEMTSPLFGADAHLDKPFEFEDLDARVAEALALRARQRSLPSSPGSAAKVVRAHRPSKAPAGARAGAKARPSASVPERAKKAKGKAPLSAGAKTTGSKVTSTKAPRTAAEAASKPAKKAASKPAKKAAAKPAKKAAAKPAKKATAKPAKKAAAKVGKPAKKAAAKPAKKAAAKVGKPAKKAAAKPAKKASRKK